MQDCLETARWCRWQWHSLEMKAVRSSGRGMGSMYSPAAGTIIFFDWDRDGVSDHVGIVEKCENGRVYTVEGNSGDAVKQEIYLESSASIMGYGNIYQ